LPRTGLFIERKILAIPDFIAAGGGHLCRGGIPWQDSNAGFQALEEKIRVNTEQVLKSAPTKGSLPREAAFRLAEQMGLRTLALTKKTAVNVLPVEAGF